MKTIDKQTILDLAIRVSRPERTVDQLRDLAVLIADWERGAK